MWLLARERVSNESHWKSEGREGLRALTDELFVAFEKTKLNAKEVRRNDTMDIWTFPTSIFFAVTVVTTIGRARV